MVLDAEIKQQELSHNEYIRENTTSFERKFYSFTLANSQARKIAGSIDSGDVYLFPSSSFRFHMKERRKAHMNLLMIYNNIVYFYYGTKLICFHIVIMIHSFIILPLMHMVRIFIMIIIINWQF